MTCSRRRADALEGRAEEIAGTMSQETSGTFGWGMFNVGLAASMFRARRASSRWSRRTRSSTSAVPGLRVDARSAARSECASGSRPGTRP